MVGQRTNGAGGRVVVLGAFVADLAFRGARLPAPGETLIASSFRLGPGGKGSNQAIAAARAGANVTFISRLGQDAFGDMARVAWAADGIDARVETATGEATGAAFIHVDEEMGENAIVVAPGAADGLMALHVDRERAAIQAADVFVAQLEQPMEAALRGLELARAAGVTTVFNPAPAAALPAELYALCDVIIPNETEISALTGLAATTVDQARRAADVLLGRGAGAVIVTLGAKGALLHRPAASTHIEAARLGAATDTAGAGDAFVGGLASALAEGADLETAARFAAVVAGLSVTRQGTASAMPYRHEIQRYSAALNGVAGGRSQ